MRYLIAVLVLSQLLGCAAFIERKLTSAQSTSEYLPIVLQHFYQQQHYCLSASKNEQVHCLHYYDLSVEKSLEDNNFNVNYDYHFIDDTRLIDNVTFSLNIQDELAPLAVIFPGYTMHAAEMINYAAWLNDIGFFPIIADGPTYQQPFDFGLRYADLLAKILAERYPERPVLLVGFSMGTSSIEPFMNQHPKVLGAIAIAPMQDFKTVGNTVFARAKQRRLLLRLIPQASVEQALTNILEINQLDSETLNFNYSAARLNQPVLVFSGEFDWIAPAINLEDDANITHIQLPYTNHFMLDHPWPEIRTQTERWIEKEQLPFNQVGREKSEFRASEQGQEAGL
ncbi:hypothetical protein AEST_12920 [Alishewanella aestuarii B11]|uniref:Serine aminopeptidase S33 domain-containing protein n=1 Tax=Alishewanella aestuarii B11 TaxID=1197174 RepID=J1YDD2_9ALTE|nr:alpha/beta hydrolase [Alishewanella aestuarii]EJI85890.1 hypothetical protein AEST_12920 [Alishewanella aestuarii B11]